MVLSIVTSLLMGCGFHVIRELGRASPRVNTPLGTIRGYWKTSYGCRRYKAFEGIPYAQPPTGEFRFREARPVLPWDGILMAKQYGSRCLQYLPNPIQILPPGIVVGSEDCLFLNIYTAVSVKTRTTLLPVIVFIHGGAFQFGAGSDYGPKYLLDRDLIFINFNYRLGPLGFLSTEDDIVPGNMGLKDQVMALRWIKDNIRYFGGDPSRITLIGQSAGGASVHYHMLSELSTGLFQQAISVSGNALNCWAQTENSLDKTKKLATILGCSSDDVQLMVDCLRIRPADLITNAIGEFMPFLHNPFTPFGPVIEKSISESTFIDRPPIEIITSGELSQDVPWITSAVSEEGLFLAAEFVASETRLGELNENWESIAPHLLDFNFTIPISDHSAVARIIRKHYLGTKPIDKQTVNQIVQMVGDRLFVYNAEKAGRLQAQAQQSPVQFYYFSYRGAHSLSEVFSGSSENFGVSHLDDALYVLDAYFDPTTTIEDRKMQQVLINLWVSFATSGTADVGVEWTKVSKRPNDKVSYLHIAGPDEIGTESSSNLGEKTFWSTIPFNENIIRD